MNDKRLTSVPLRNICINDSYWTRYIDTIFENGIKYQWEVINDRVEGAEESHSINNFLIAAKRIKGKFGGKVFQDTDVAKWLEAVGYSLEIRPNAEIEQLADWTIDLIGDAQWEDGYINTYYTIEEPNGRWTNLVEGHELYTAGHLIEAAVAYFSATGKDKFIKIVSRFADLICKTFGDGEDQISAYEGHPEIELALVKLYYATGEKRYLEMSKYFVDKRGTKPDYFKAEIEKRNHNFIFPELEGFDPSYYINHIPVKEQKDADGHAVRNVYLYSAAADIASEYEDEELLEACRRNFKSISEKRMYITGSIGSSGVGERFSCDYDLPNNSNYSESCASIGLALFSRRMLEIEKDSKYADVMEDALYNTVLAGISLKGDRFFYVNPLEVVPEFCERNTSLSHVKPERQKWFGVACCPTNIVRTLASLGQYIYSVGKDEVYVNLFINNEAKVDIGDNKADIKIKTEYPFKSNVDISVYVEKKSGFTLAIRIPKWCTLKKVSLNDDKNYKNYSIEKGYIKIKNDWTGSTVIHLEYDMPARFVYANPKVRADAGKTALVKGPVVYCLEEIDNFNNLGGVLVDTESQLVEVYEKDLLGGTLTITASALRIAEDDSTELYRTEKPKTEKVKIKYIPYCLWNNREKGEMAVWVRYK